MADNVWIRTYEGDLVRWTTVARLATSRTAGVHGYLLTAVPLGASPEDSVGLASFTSQGEAQAAGQQLLTTASGAPSGTLVRWDNGLWRTSPL